jgi:iron complex outermembrane receptor protein
VTIATTATQTTQQRQNLGRTRVWGLQTDVDVRIAEAWRIGGGYLYDDATVREYRANPAIVGKFLPQVPQHRGSIQVSYTSPRIATISLGVQAVGTQFDDDANTRVVSGRSNPGLPKYALVDVNVGRALGRNLDLFVGVQNLFNTTYYVGTLPTTVGSPRLFTGGARLRLSGG